MEACDLASGTSSRSSKLIHGGLRYLEQFDFKLVYEALLVLGLFTGGEAAEGIRAFIAKRAPDFAREIAPRPA